MLSYTVFLYCFLILFDTSSLFFPASHTQTSSLVGVSWPSRSRDRYYDFHPKIMAFQCVFHVLWSMCFLLCCKRFLKECCMKFITFLWRGRKSNTIIMVLFHTSTLGGHNFFIWELALLHWYIQELETAGGQILKWNQLLHLQHLSRLHWFFPACYC